MLVNTSTHKVLIDCDKKEIIWSQPIAAKAANQDWNKNSRSLAYTIANNLFVTTADGKTHQVTDEPKGIVCGQSVHRQAPLLAVQAPHHLPGHRAVVLLRGRH